MIDCISMCVFMCLLVFCWIVFNVVVGNVDVYLKNLLFFVDVCGYWFVLFYDIVSMVVYYMLMYWFDYCGDYWLYCELMMLFGNVMWFVDIDMNVLVVFGYVLGFREKVVISEL